MGAEYSVLGLIEDATLSLKVATVLCAISGLLVLESETWLRRQYKYLFATSVGVVSIVYLAFVGYAISYATGKQARQAKLRELYAAVEPIIERDIPSHIEGWSRRTGRFLDTSSIQVICWSKIIIGCDSRYDIPKNRLNAEKKNLSTIIETPAYDQ
jgi:hypothetical protein